MYNSHFELKKAPFRITPDTRQFFEGGQRAAILETLKYAITSGEGIVKVTGEVGTGKTMLCRMLQEQLADTVEIIYLANPSLNRDQTLTAICMELGLESPPGRSHFDQQQALQSYLLETHRRGRKVVIFIEEAQQIPLDTLEEIRLLSNLETDQHKLLQIVLIGQPELRDRLDRNELRQLRQRITVRYHLGSISRQETVAYIQHRLLIAGSNGRPTFTRPAYRAIHSYSRGVPRLINAVCDKALLCGYVQGRDHLGWRQIRRAIHDLEGQGW